MDNFVTNGMMCQMRQEMPKPGQLTVPLVSADGETGRPR